MLPRRWMEAYINFLLRRRWIVLGLAIVLTAFFVYQLGHTKIQMNFLDFYPPGHPYMQLVKKHARMFGSAVEPADLPVADRGADRDDSVHCRPAADRGHHVLVEH